MNDKLRLVVLNLLRSFGDTVNQEQIDDVYSMTEPDPFSEQAKRLQLYSNKHKALYLYTYRLLRPIWEMPLTSYTHLRKLWQQDFNTEKMYPACERLIKLLDFIST